ncbi:MAG: phage portal protein [Acutalibacteraceae bacterium]
MIISIATIRANSQSYTRTKEIRPEINNIIVENRANEIVTFKVAYLVGAPIQYVNRGKEEVLEDINKLNEFVFAEDKATKDKELAEWFTICGTGYRIALPDPVGEEDESPFEIYTLDPRNTFVVYSSKLGQRRLMGCMVLHKQDGEFVTAFIPIASTMRLKITR